MFSPSLTTDTQTHKTTNKRRLTRARQLRYLRDCDGEHLDAFLNSAVDTYSPPPQPLPLPDSPPLYSGVDRIIKERRRSKLKPLVSDRFCLPPPAGIYAWEVQHNGMGNADGQRRVDSLHNIDPHRLSADTHRSVLHAETWSSRNAYQTITSPDQARKNLGVDVTFRSAPPSATSSPMVSPQRIQNGDLFSSYHEDPNRFSELAIPSGFLNTSRSENNVVSLSHHKPPRKCTSGPSSPRHPKLQIEVSSFRNESNFGMSVHRLPLPPTCSPLAQASSSHQVSAWFKSSPVKNQWIKGKLIGRGTFGSVYAATNRETGASCAMKEVELCSDDLKSAECVRQLEQEIKVLSHLKHPNIVQYYGSEIVDDKFYIYLEYVYPGSINKYVREHCGDITEAVVRNFTRHICSGLAYLHGRNTIHRDIKGANLLVDSSGVVKLADFGMAKLLTGQAADLSFKGSPYWMAPELMECVKQEQNRSDLAYAVDIWSLGCTIIEMLTGKHPWSGLEPGAAMFTALKKSPPIPETLSPEGKDFVKCCLQRKPADRPPASRLLEHPFLKNCQQLDVPFSSPARNVTNQMDKAYSPREIHHHKFDKIPRSPIRRSQNGKCSVSESGVLPYLTTNERTKVSHHSPRSTLEPLTSPGLGPFPKLLVSPNSSNGYSSGADRKFYTNPWV